MEEIKFIQLEMTEQEKFMATSMFYWMRKISEISNINYKPYSLSWGVIDAQ